MHMIPNNTSYLKMRENLFSFLAVNNKMKRWKTKGMTNLMMRKERVSNTKCKKLQSILQQDLMDHLGICNQESPGSWVCPLVNHQITMILTTLFSLPKPCPTASMMNITKLLNKTKSMNKYPSMPHQVAQTSTKRIRLANTLLSLTPRDHTKVIENPRELILKHQRV